MGKKGAQGGEVRLLNDADNRMKGDAGQIRRDVEKMILMKDLPIIDIDGFRVTSWDWIAQEPDAFYGPLPAASMPAFVRTMERPEEVAVAQLPASWVIKEGAPGPAEEGYSKQIKLKPILCAINEAQDILKLEEGWDGDSGLPINKATLDKATGMLLAYAVYISEHFDLSLLAPQIDAVPNGSVDLFWKEPKAQLLINIKPEAKHASYYGDRYVETEKIKGNVPVYDVKEYMAVWMKNLSS